MLNQAGLKAVHIPYKGAGPAKTAAMAGEIDFITDVIGAAMGQITGKTLVPLAVAAEVDRYGKLIKSAGVKGD
jgi:tripartite-type tricarboxylate transporter receptor subunit TctC